MGAGLREVVPIVGEVWTTLDVVQGQRADLLWAARFLIGHCHVGAFALPWHDDEWVACPWCGDDFTRDHMIWECRGLSHERRSLLRGIGEEKHGDLRWLALRYGSRIGWFARAAGRLIETVDVANGHE